MKKLILLAVMLVSLVSVSCSDDGDGGNDDPKTCTPVCDAWETCNTTTGTCVLTAGKCETNTDCTTIGYFCNTTTNTCEKEEATCNTVCESWETCNNGNCELTLGKCNSNAECTGEGIVCNLTTHSCETETIECTPACEAWEICAQGTCILAAGKCNTTADCTGTDTCNTATHICENSNPTECTGLSVATDAIVYNPDYEYYKASTGDIDLIITFFDQTPVGDYDLTSELNNNFSSCLQCIRLEKFEGDSIESNYFQSFGTLSITSGNGLSDTSSGIITNVKLIEVTIGSMQEGYVSTPVENGRCYEIETAFWNTAVGK